MAPLLPMPPVPRMLPVPMMPPIEAAFIPLRPAWLGVSTVGGAAA